MKKIFKNILIIFGMTFFIIITISSCAEKINIYDKSLTQKNVEIKKLDEPPLDDTNWVDSPVDVCKNENIFIGSLYYSTSTLSYSHNVGISYHIKFEIEKNEDNQYLIKKVYFNYGLKITQVSNSLTQEVEYVYDVTNTRIYDITAPLRLDNLNGIFLSANLNANRQQDTFYANLNTYFCLDILYSNSELVFLRETAYYNYSPPVSYISWNFTECRHVYNMSIKAFNDMFNAGGEIWYNTGYQTGYVNGYIDGEDNSYNHRWIESLFSAANTLFSIEIFPNLKLWYIIGAPMIVAVVVAVFKILR